MEADIYKRSKKQLLVSLERTVMRVEEIELKLSEVAKGATAIRCANCLYGLVNYNIKPYVACIKTKDSICVKECHDFTLKN